MKEGEREKESVRFREAPQIHSHATSFEFLFGELVNDLVGGNVGIHGRLGTLAQQRGQQRAHVLSQD